MLVKRGKRLVYWFTTTKKRLISHLHKIQHSLNMSKKRREKLNCDLPIVSLMISFSKYRTDNHRMCMFPTSDKDKILFQKIAILNYLPTCND